MSFQEKYLKYKKKYLNLKKLLGGAIQLNCPKCKKEYNLADDHAPFKCDVCNIMIFPKSFNSISKISQDNLIDGIISFMRTFKEECHADFMVIPNETVTKCKYINKEHMNSDIIMGYDKRQKQEVLTHDNIVQYIRTIDMAEYPLYFCYFISNKGVKFGRVYDVLEYGASHMMLSDDDEEIIIAGEIKCTRDDIVYNFESGSVNWRMILLFLEKNGIKHDKKSEKNVSQKLQHLITYFDIYEGLCNKILPNYFPGIKFTDTNLIIQLENVPIHPKTKTKICDNPLDRNMTYQLDYNVDPSNNGGNIRCKNNSIFRMEDGDGKLAYRSLDTDINTMSLFTDEQREFDNISAKINDKKIINKQKYSNHLFCNK